MKSASTKCTFTIIVELHPSRVPVKAGPSPLHSSGRRSSHKGGQEVHCIVQRVDDRPWELLRQQGSNISGAKRQLQGTAVQCEEQRNGEDCDQETGP
nr:hypothetical protein Iba_chr03bCG11680 [Ipomoea batatas]